MKFTFPLYTFLRHKVFSALLLLMLLPVGAAHGQVILFNLLNNSGFNDYASVDAPPGIPASGARWNLGRNSDGEFGTAGTLYYADQTVATGVAVTGTRLVPVTDSTPVYNFASPTNPTANTGSARGDGIFSSIPGNSAISGASLTVPGGNYGGVGLRLTGLTYGTYEIHAIAAFVGGTANRQPGESSAAVSNVFAFAAPSGTTSFAYNSPYLTTPSDTLENTNPSAWVLGDNYALLTVTLSAENPELFIFSQTPAGSGHNASLNALQLTLVPEPSCLLLLAASGMVLLTRRRRSPGS